MTDFSTALVVATWVLLIGTMFLCARNAQVLAELSARLTRCERSRPESLQRQLEELQSALAELATSVKMSRVRRAALPQVESKAEPDPYTEPDAWRKMIASKMAAAKINGS